ncbi:hypothetical protein LJR220_005535 [Bradyrhizobium sp. LjRoot220]|uniref:hypothetical protein n=1 Tax=Bradyrhizobium sp. LjRoot220 TaxID=3342284 RepID=UPI003ECCC8BA
MPARTSSPSPCTPVLITLVLDQLYPGSSCSTLLMEGAAMGVPLSTSLALYSKKSSPATPPATNATHIIEARVSTP